MDSYDITRRQELYELLDDWINTIEDNDEREYYERHVIGIQLKLMNEIAGGTKKCQ